MIAFIRDLLGALSRPCSGHAELISRSMDGPLSAGDRLGLRLHTSYCKGCRRFAQHAQQLRNLSGRVRDAIESGPGMPPEVRARLNERLGQEPDVRA